MKHILLFFLLMVFCISCKEKDLNLNETRSDSTIELGNKIDEYFSALTEIGKFNGVLYVVKNNQEIIQKAYNLNQDKESTLYVTTESQFDIHSVSKLMALYLIEKFENEGQVKKTQTIDKFFPGFPNGDEISIEMLLSHTSGLPRNFENVEGNEIDLSSDEIIKYAKNQKLIFQPGTDTQYSNVGYELVYFIIQKTCNKNFAQCLADELFRPVGMTNSGAHFYTDKKNLRNLAKNHEKDDGAIVQVDNILKDELKTARIFSTAKDLNGFLGAIKKEPYASVLKNEADVIEKSGGSDGIRVEVYTSLAHDYNFVLLANYEEIPFKKTITDLSKILEGKPYDLPKELNRKAINLPVEKINKYVGTYTFADMNNLELSFKVEHKNLVVYQDGEKIATLKAESVSTFFDDPKEPESFMFIDKGDGNYDVLMGWKGVELPGIKK